MNSSQAPPATTLLRTSIDSPGLLNPLIERIAHAAPDTDREGAFPEDAFRWLAEAGLLAITLPGHDLDFDQGQTARLLHLLKRIGSANLAVGRLYEGHINALYLIHLFASPEQRTRWYTDVTQHQRLFSVWNTQADNGVRIDEVNFPSNDGVYRLSGTKTFCSGADWIQRPLITGELQATDQHGNQRKGWQMAIVPTEQVSPIAQDARFWQPLGMRASASFKLDFTGVELTDADLLGQSGNYFRQPYFSGGAIRFAAVQLGGAEALYEATRQFLVGLNRTDDLLQQTRLAEMAYLIESGNHWLQTAGDNTDRWLAEGADWTKIVAYANMARTAIEEICLRVMPLSERCVGARGLLRPHPFERIHRDLTHYLRQPAPDATLVDIGNYVLTNPQPPMNSGINQAHRLNDLAVEITDLQTIGSALVIAPHPDDESLGCGGTIAQLRAQGYPVHVVFVSDGTLSHPNSKVYPAERLRDLRESEAREALRILTVGPDDCTFLRYRDRQVPTVDAPEFTEAGTRMATLIDELMPATVFVPWRRDPHPDHRASWQIVQQALQQTITKPRLLEYLIWLWELGTQDDMPTPGEVKVWRVSIDSVMDQRNRAIAAHQSQVTRLIDDDPTGFYLSPELMTHFDQPRELFLEARTTH